MFVRHFVEVAAMGVFSSQRVELTPNSADNGTENVCTEFDSPATVTADIFSHTSH